jgi:hypothetical protein
MSEPTSDPELDRLLASLGIADTEQDGELEGLLAELLGEQPSRLIVKHRQGGRSIHTEESLRVHNARREVQENQRRKRW